MFLVADIGGTKLSASLFDNTGMHQPLVIPTLTNMGQEVVIKRIILMFEQVLMGETPEAISIACPGPLSSRRGEVDFAPCLGWKHVPIVKIIEEHFNCPVYLENDANAAAFGEYRMGAGRGTSSMAYITISTGVGCGIIINEHVLQGFHEGAGEIGHLTIKNHGRKCPCGKRGCLERYASGTAIGEDASRIMQHRGENMGLLSAKDAADIARAGDYEMKRLFENAGIALGRGISSLLQLFDIERIVIGGSVSQAMDLMEHSIRDTVAVECYWGKSDNDWLRKAELGNNSGLIGAFEIARQKVTGKDYSIEKQ